MRTLYAIDDEHDRKSKRSLFALIGDLPSLLVKLVKLELAQLKAEMIAKATKAGIGAGLLFGAAFFGFFAFAVLIAAAVLALALVLPGWLSALIIGVVLLVVMVILALLGIRSLKKAMPPVPEKTIDGLRHDVNAIKGTGRYEN